MQITITAPLYVNEAWGGDVQSAGVSIVGTWVMPGATVEASADMWEHFQCHGVEGASESTPVSNEPEPHPEPAPEPVEGSGTIAEARHPEGSPLGVVGAARRRARRS